MVITAEETRMNIHKSKNERKMIMKKKNVWGKKAVTMAAMLAVGVAMFTGCGNKPAEPAKEAKETTVKSTEEPMAEETEAAKTSDEKYSVVLVTIDSMDQHWVNMDKGCKKAAEELGVDYQWIAPDVKDDSKQIECINNAVAGGCDAILIAANGPDAVTAALEEAENAGVKIVQVDSFANYPSVQRLGTDNKSAGKQAGEQVLAALKEKGVAEGKIGVVSVNAATTSTVDRDLGFRSAFEGSKYEILETQYADGDAAKSKDVASNFITQGCVALFGANEGSCVGVGNAVLEEGNSVVAAGMDKSDAVLQLIKDGSLICTMAQNPDIMGYDGVTVAVAALKGETITTEYVDTGVSIITKDTLK